MGDKPLYFCKNQYKSKEDEKVNLDGCCIPQLGEGVVINCFDRCKIKESEGLSLIIQKLEGNCSDFKITNEAKPN